MLGLRPNFSKKSPTGPSERTPKPEYIIARSQLTERGPLGFGPIQLLMDLSPCMNLLVWVKWLATPSCSTLPKTNMAPENRPSQKEIHLPTIHFQGRTVSFNYGISWVQTPNTASQWILKFLPTSFCRNNYCHFPTGFTRVKRQAAKYIIYTQGVTQYVITKSNTSCKYVIDVLGQTCPKKSSTIVLIIVMMMIVIIIIIS